jgi:hypothetical protein
MSVALHGKQAQESTVLIDTTKIAKWVKSGFLMIVPIYAKISKNKIKTFNAYTLPKVH